MTEPAELRRQLSTASLTLYGVGVIVGAGIYVLVGEVVAQAGAAGWLAFVGACLAALPTGLSYAELASRHPESAGEAVYASRAFDRPFVSFLVGFLIVASGVMSTAAVSHGFAHYLRLVIGMPDLSPVPLVVGFLGLLSWVNYRGIRESTWLNATCTVVSVAALLALALGGVGHWADASPTLIAAPTTVPAGALLGAVALAFYAFIGFEDICNVAEEVKTPSRSIPRAILLSLAISGVVYLLVTWTALSVVDVDDLAGHGAPIALVSERVWPGVSPAWLSSVALLAVTNTALFNLVMTSRVLFGMARSGWIPARLAHVDPKTRTPVWGVALAFVLAATLAVTGVLDILAEATNVVILLAFTAVNLALLTIRIRKIPPDTTPDQIFRIPLFVPVLGIALTLVLLTRLSPAAWIRAGALVLVGILLHAAVRWLSPSKT